MRSDEKSRTRSMGIYFRFEKILGSFGQRSGNQFRIVWKLIEIESMITGGRRGSARGRGGIERERRDRTMILSEPPRSERIEENCCNLFNAKVEWRREELDSIGP